MLNLICKELGVEIGEEWLGNDGHTYKIDENGDISMEVSGNGCVDCLAWSEVSGLWGDLVVGELKPVSKPKAGEVYYIPAVDELDKYIDFTWADCDDDEVNHRRGLVFKTKEEAIECANKMLGVIKKVRSNM